MVTQTCLLLLAAIWGQPSDANAAGAEAICEGEVQDDWTFAADATDGLFLHVIWTGPQGQRRVSKLTYYATNADELPVFTGTLQGIVDVVLVDQSGGAPTDGTEVLVYTEEWGWMPGSCRELAEEAAPHSGPAETVRQSLVGTRDTTATGWLRRQGFTRGRIVEHSSTGKTESWRQDPDTLLEVIFYRGRVSDVRPVTP